MEFSLFWSILEILSYYSKEKPENFDFSQLWRHHDVINKNDDFLWGVLIVPIRLSTNTTVLWRKKISAKSQNRGPGDPMTSSIVKICENV